MNDWIDGKLELSDFDEELQTKFYNCYPPETRLEKNPLIRISPSFLRKYQDLLWFWGNKVTEKLTEKLTKTRYDASREDIATILGDAPKYRLDQVWQGLYTEFQEPLEITTISKDLRTRLDKALPSSLAPITSSVSDRGDTTKFLWQLKIDQLLTVINTSWVISTTCFVKVPLRFGQYACWKIYKL